MHVVAKACVLRERLHYLRQSRSRSFFAQQNTAKSVVANTCLDRGDAGDAGDVYHGRPSFVPRSLGRCRRLQQRMKKLQDARQKHDATTQP